MMYLKTPERRERTMFWAACLYCRVGKPDRALQILKEALQRRIWWSRESLLCPDLIPLQSNPEFKVIQRECERLKEESQAEAEAKLLIVPPSAYTRQRAYPLLIVFHARGENAVEFAQFWRIKARPRLVLAFLQSSQVWATDSFCWDNIVVAEKDIRSAFSQLQDSYNVDTSKVMLAGFSQGAALAIYSALRGLVSCRGFIAVSPGVELSPRDNMISPSLLTGNLRKTARGAVLIGDKDVSYPSIKRFYSALIARGVRCQLQVERGLGHELPTDFPARLSSAVGVVLS